MSAPPSHLFHGGVLKAAGVVHVGTASSRVGAYARDARGYSRGLMVEHHIEEARRVARQGDECQRRSWVAAVADLVRWMHGDAAMTPTEPAQSPTEQGEETDRQNDANRQEAETNRGVTNPNGGTA